MSISIKLKLLLFSMLSITLAVVIGASGYIGITQVDEAMDEIVLNSQALGNHLTADMMHDALRSDVLAALLAASQGQHSLKSEIDKDLAEHAKIFHDLIAINETLNLNQKIKSQLSATKPALENYIKTSESIVSLAFDDYETANKQMEEFKVNFDKLAVAMESLSELFDKSTSESQQGGDAAVTFSKAAIIIVLISALVILIPVSMFLSSRLTRSLSQAVHIAKNIADGDLTEDIPISSPDSKDESIQLLNALSEMSTRLTEIVSNVRHSTEDVTTAAGEIAKGNLDLSQRTEEQASSLEETASSMEEMTSTVKQNADNARQANQLAISTREEAEKGGEVVDNAVNAMSEITTSSKKIADIIGVIDEIAFQTNLLALNAAVEAARAGEQGRGFAVVASEVRTLAGRSADAAKEIKGLITDSVNKVEQGNELVNATGKNLEQIVNGVKKVTDIISEIAASSQEQANGIEQVNSAVMQMDEMTQQNAALVEQATAASRSMEEQAKILDKQMEFFHVDGVAT